jgi:hypothetical protein
VRGLQPVISRKSLVDTVTTAYKRNFAFAARWRYAIICLDGRSAPLHGAEPKRSCFPSIFALAACPQ